MTLGASKREDGDAASGFFVLQRGSRPRYASRVGANIALCQIFTMGRAGLEPATFGLKFRAKRMQVAPSECSELKRSGFAITAELHRTALCGDHPVLQSVLHGSPPAKNRRNLERRLRADPSLALAAMLDERRRRRLPGFPRRAREAQPGEQA